MLYNRGIMKANLDNHNPETLKSGRGMNPFLLVILSFLIVIIVGTILLYMPFSQTTGHFGDIYNFIDCFFTAVSATCVTGLCSFANGIGNQLTFFGQLVVLIMIQIGGLGFITVIAFIITLFKTKISFKHRDFLSKAVGSTSFGHVVLFVRKIILTSFTIEIIGTGLFVPVFLQCADATPANAIWRSIFHSVSSFNNAGWDIMGNTSLIYQSGAWTASLPAWAYTYMLVVTMILIVFGGISFLVIFDVFSKKSPRQWRAFTKAVLVSTTILLVTGTLLFILFECTKTTNRMNVLDAMFQSVAARTAGFSTYDQTNLSVGGSVVSCVLMFIGGSPLGTAGGVKTTTIFMIFIALNSFVSGREMHAFNRSYSLQGIIKAMVLLSMSVIFITVCYGVIAAIESSRDLGTDVLLFECFSAFGTVGFSKNLTPQLQWGSKLVLTVLMFVGRLGPMTLFQVVQKNLNKETKRGYSYIEEDFLIG